MTLPTPSKNVALPVAGVAAILLLSVAPLAWALRVAGFTLIALGAYMIMNGKTVSGTFKGTSGGTSIEGAETAYLLAAGIFLLFLSWLLGG